MGSPRNFAQPGYFASKTLRIEADRQLHERGMELHRDHRVQWWHSGAVPILTHLPRVSIPWRAVPMDHEPVARLTAHFPDAGFGMTQRQRPGMIGALVYPCTQRFS